MNMSCKSETIVIVDDEQGDIQKDYIRVWMLLEPLRFPPAFVFPVVSLC